MFSRLTLGFGFGLTLCSCLTGSSFIKMKTGISLSKDISVCGTGVKDNPQCEPTGVGGAPWQKNGNFPFYNVPTQYTTYEQILAEVRRYYLGSPFFDFDLHPSCKRDVGSDSIDASQITMDLDLAAELNRRSVSEVTAELKAKLQAKKIDVAAEIANKFERSLSEQVNQKVAARFIWFVFKYRGGATGINENPALQACRDTLRDYRRSDGRGDGSFVTGVAGYIILNNRVDVTIESDSTISNALEVALEGQYPQAMADLKGSLAAKWKKSVQKTLKVKLSRVDLDTVVYPLWVQFEYREPGAPPPPPPPQAACAPSPQDAVHTSGPNEKGSIQVASCTGLQNGHKYQFKLIYTVEGASNGEEAFRGKASLRLCQGGTCGPEVALDKDIVSNGALNTLDSAVTTLPLSSHDRGGEYTLRLTYAENQPVKQFTVIPQSIEVESK